MYKAQIKDTEYEVEFRNGELFMNGSQLPLSVKKRRDGGFDIDYEGKTNIADVLKLDRAQKLLVLRISNKKYTVHIKEPMDLLIDSLGIRNKFHKRINNLKAPMPGLVSRILVREGASVKQGEALLVLEAMKMENIFKAATDVVIGSIRVKEKQAVEKGEELITFVS